jgi:heat shock protein HslJ
MTRWISLAIAGILVTGCEGGGDDAGGPGALAGTKWRLVSWSNRSLDPSRYTITAEFSESNVSGRAAVNSYSASYQAGADGTFSVGQVQSTLMGGAPDAMQAEATYVELLRQARRYELLGGQLRMRNAAHQELLVFQRVGDAQLEFTGTVRWRELEGGFYAIDADDGRKFEPLNLSRDFRVDGLRVRVIAKPRPDMASIRMYGTPIEIVRISRL